MLWAGMDRILNSIRIIFSHFARAMSSDPSSFEWTTQAANTTLFSCLSRSAGERPALPGELILQILDHPSRWVCSFHAEFPGRPSRISTASSISAPSIEDSEEPVLRVASNGPLHLKVVLSTKPLTSYQIANLRQIIFTFYSRDQGWSGTQRQDGGTFRGSWSWFEAGVRREGEAGVQSGGERDTEAEYDAASDTESEAESEQHEQPAGDKYERHELQRNRHASRKPEDYRVEIGPDHELLQSLKEGDVIDVLACAQYPAWTNIVHRASIEIWTMDDLKSLRPAKT